MTRLTLYRCFIVLSLLTVFLAPGARAQTAEPVVLARLELAGPIERLGDLPVYAHLQDAAGRDYLLVIAEPSRLDRTDWPYQVLDAPAWQPADYGIALARRAGDRALAAHYVIVLHDDGRQIIARAAGKQADQAMSDWEALAGLGFDLMRLGDPLVWPAAGPGELTVGGISDPLVGEMIGQVQQSTVYTYTGRLSGEWPAVVGGAPYTIATRHTSSGTPIQKATQYVYEHMQALGLDVSYHSWSLVPYSNRNVIGAKSGVISPGEIVLVTAHLDDTSGSYMTLAPGADDNASGSVGVLVAADILSRYRFQRTLRFVFFTGEEQGLYGSQAYANTVYNAGENIVAVYNMDMIAWDKTGGPSLRIHTRQTSSPGYAADLAIATVFTSTVTAYGLAGGLTPILDPDGISASDHYRFWEKGYPGILAIEDDISDFNAYYHTVNDRLANVNMTYFTNYVRASVGTAARLAYPVPWPKLAISKTAASATVTVGSPLTYTLRISDTGGLATGVVVSDTLPAYAQFAWASSGGAPNGGDVLWGGLGLAASDSLTLTLGVTTTCAPDQAAIVNDRFQVYASEWLTPTVGAPVTVTAAFPLPLAIGRSGSDVLLTWWHPCSGLASYAVYGAAAPYLAPGVGGSAQITAVAPPAAGSQASYPDIGALNPPPDSYYYKVQAVGPGGQVYATSTEVGVFSFVLEAGTP